METGAARQCCRFGMRHRQTPIRIIWCAAGKGFGQAKSAETAAVPLKKRRKGKGGQQGGGRQLQQQTEQGSAQRQQFDPSLHDPGADFQQSASPAGGRFEEKLQQERTGQENPDVTFSKRLADLKAAGVVAKAARPAQQDSSLNMLDVGRPNYDNPPPITETLFGSADDGGSAFGLPQIGVAVGSLALVVVFLFSSGGSDLVQSTQQAAPAASAGSRLGEQARKDLEARAAQFEDTLKASPADVAALEGAAVSRAQLGDFTLAAGLLEKLAVSKADDRDVWRLLGEAKLELGEGAAAARAYEKAIGLSPTADFELLQGLAGALVVDGKPQQAIAAVKAVEGKEGIGAVERQLLLGKVFAQWKGHTNDAISVYDIIVKEHPEDFRPYLAKGLVLQQQGQKGDATRYFIQARYFAPAAARGVVDAIIGQQK